MTFKDRTQEFNTVAESIRTKQSNSKSHNWKTPKHQKSQFMLTASQIGKDIFETSEKLGKLAKLAKKNSIFDNPTVEIEELTYIIKQDIQNLNRQITTLKDIAQIPQGKASSANQGLTHSKTVIGYLNYKLADTTKGFKDILQVRTENLKTQQERRLRFTGGSTALGPTTPPPVHRFAAEHASSLPDSPQSGGGGEVAISMPGGVLLQQEHTSSRVAAVESIEKTLVELQGIFGDLVSLVAEQGDMIQRLDANIDNTALYVDRGHSELLKNLYNISSNRGLIIKLFIVLIVFVVMFVVFVV
jgi:syntaxin 5